jgi:hypothetical protein
MARKKFSKFNPDLYKMLDSEDKKHYMSKDFLPTRSYKLRQQQPKKGPTDTPKRMPLPVWQDRNLSNQGTKLNP